ncbi:MAG: CaiB/BaiF CoA transferase family protein, partial [Acidimicrobiales bacterium]
PRPAGPLVTRGIEMGQDPSPDRATSGTGAGAEGAADGPYLDGVTVLDFSQYLAGPSCTKWLAEMGADVIKVEMAPWGDPQRGGVPRRNKRAGGFVQQNRGKRSLCVDLRRPEGLALVKELVPHVDVVVENYSAGVMDRRGLGYAELSAIHPGVIMASISGFGQTGPLTHKTAFDYIAQAYSGLMHITGDADGPPMPTGVALADNNAGFHAFAGLGYALYRRTKTGIGCHIDISMVEALFHMQEHAVHSASMDPDYRASRQGPHYGPLSPAGVFKGPEGWIVILCTQLQIDGLWEAMGRPEFAADDRFATPNDRLENREALTDEIERWMATFADDQSALDALEAARVPCSPVLDPTDAVNHPFFVERRAVRQVTDPLVGTIDIPGFPIKFSDAPPEPDLPTHALGQDNADVLRDVLGYDDERISSLEAQGVLASKQH